MLRIVLLVVASCMSFGSASRLKYRPSVQENVDLYHTIISLDQMLTVDYQQSMEFLNLNSPYATYFLVDGQKLRTSRLIDREEFCRIKLCENSRCHPCEINMDFVLKENGQPRDIISLVLTVEDVNEFRPQFLENSRDGQSIRLNISEGVPVGHVMPIPSATDKDGEDDELVYWLAPAASKVPFELISFGSNQIALNVTEPLDRETQDFYNLTLIARDHGNLTSAISIHISISDVNDNVPVFDQQTPYIINVSENTAPSATKPLLRIHAIDHDSNENGRVVYNFSPQVSELLRQTFRLNTHTGELFLLQPLDYEQLKEYRLAITAQDSGPVSVPVYTAVIVNVEDENDNEPRINLRVSDNFQLHNDTLYISESTALNALLMHVIVQDADSNLNGRVACAVESSDGVNFNVTNTLTNMFSLYTNQLFDYEQRSNYSFRLVVEDFGVKVRQQTSRDLRLIITDVNDCSPVFSQSSYGVVLQADEEYRQHIVQFQATDADSNENGRVTYHLVPSNEQSLFSLDEKTGKLFVRHKLNQSTYNLTIRAQDHGVHPAALHTDVSCHIQVLLKPRFERENYLFHHVDETIAVNASIGFARATPSSAQSIVYSVSTPAFRIDRTTGELFINEALDYDTNQSCHRFQIAAENADGLNSTCSAEVCLQPINEYSPEIHSTSRLIYANLDNTSAVPINAFDRDSSPSSFLSFQCHNPSKCALLCSPNGTIYVNSTEHCLGIVDLFVSIDDNDRHPSKRITNDTIRLIFFSNAKPLEQVLASSGHQFAVEMIIISNVFILISAIICLASCIAYRQRKQALLSKSTQSKIIKDQIGFTENHSLLNDDLVDMANINLKINSSSDTSSSYNDSCYGSSEMDVHHHHHHLGSKPTDKLLVSSAEKYIILAKDQNNINRDETHSTSSSSSSPASSAGTNVNLIAKYQVNQGVETTPLKSTEANCEFFRSNSECKRVLGTTTTFNYRNITPLNEYYL